MITDYSSFIDTVNNIQMRKSEYYTHLLKFRHEIIVDAEDRGQALVAKDLKINQPKLSTIIQFLKIIDNNKDMLCKENN